VPHRFIFVCVATLTTIAVLVLIVTIQRLPLIGVLCDLPGRLYVPHYNTFKIEEIGRVNASLVFYGGLIVAIPLGLMLNRFLKRRESTYDVIWTMELTVFVLFTLVCVAGQSRSIAREWSRYSGKNIDEKKEAAFGQAYRLAESLRQQLPAPCDAALVTNECLPSGSWNLDCYAFRYYAYPVNMRFASTEPVDFLVFFMKKDFGDCLRPGFRITHRFDDKNAIAVRDRALTGCVK